MAETKKKATEATKTKEEAPKRAHFDEFKFGQLKGDYERSLRILQIAVDKYEELGVGKATDKVFRAIIINNLSQVKNEYLEKMESDIQEATKNKVLAAKLREAVDEPFDRFEEKVAEQHRGVQRVFMEGISAGFLRRLNWEYFQFKDGKVTFDEKALEDECSVFVNSESRKKFFKLAEETEKQLQELQQMAKEYAPNGIPAPVMPGSAHKGYLFNYGGGEQIKMDAEWLKAIH
jgi:hypothetical protein